MPKAKKARPTSRKGLPRRQNASPQLLPKAATGIDGLDEITGGGFPRARPTLLCGGAGCGKTMLAMEFLARGALEIGGRRVGHLPGEAEQVAAIHDLVQALVQGEAVEHHRVVVRLAAEHVERLVGGEQPWAPERTR